jgi:predicted Zn finger-like uncharacterized protein
MPQEDRSSGGPLTPSSQHGVKKPQASKTFQLIWLMAEKIRTSVSGDRPMEITCDSCKTKLNVPDEKVPPDQQVTVACPKCKEKLTLGPKTSKNPQSTPESNTGAEEPLGSDEDALEFYDDGAKLALVAENNPDLLEKLKESVEDAGYKVVSVENTGEAISKMRFHTFHLVIISDDFDGIELAQSPVLQYLNHLSMTIRRRMFVALIGDSFNTMDHMTAFAMSANLVVGRRDADKMTGILKNAIADNEKFYKIFMDMLVQVGRS